STKKLSLLTLDKNNRRRELESEAGNFRRRNLICWKIFSKTKSSIQVFPSKLRKLKSMVVRFFDLINQLPYDVNFDEVLSLLNEYALLVQGCWVLKSEFSIEEGFEDARTDIQRTLLLAARDFLLYKFTKNRVVLLRELERMLPIEEHIWRYFLMEIARMVPRLGWQFVRPKDINFLHSSNRFVP
ncbi:conserved hypothetical protein, partial [Trichinella spiralis]|uniref:hypothetical protein n=1 Tax=Trichinella spiralis TaxID=6334 RepID=UPI0001EFDEEE